MRWLENRIPPPLVLALFAAAMWGAARLAPSLTAPFPARGLAAIVLVLAGVVTLISGLLQFAKAKTTVSPLNPEAASALVVGGVYELTRNPMYLGMVFILSGWAAYLANALAAPFIFAFILYIDRFQITPEERALAARFGGAFEAYKKKVRRWI